MKRKTARAFSLIEILVVMVLLIVAAAFILPHYLGGRTMDGKTVKSPRTAAHDVECSEYLGQVRMAISMAKIGNENEANPASLSELKETSSIRKCPVGGEEYVYNPQTGEVHCPHPGHERY